MPKRTANAKWSGSVSEGDGTVALGSGAFEGPYSFTARTQEGASANSNPEELIAGAHAGCFTMMLSHLLSEAGTPPETIESSAEVELRMSDLSISSIRLTTKARVPGLDDAAFQQIAVAAKEGCPVSKALASVDEVTLDATLES